VKGFPDLKCCAKAESGFLLCAALCLGPCCLLQGDQPVSQPHEPFHLERYVTEQVFRFNNRSTKKNPLNDADRFALAVSQISGKRLTYAEWTGKVGEMSADLPDWMKRQKRGKRRL
jgi:hypothetical protein